VLSPAAKIANALKARGRSGDWMAICPSHAEKTASLHITETKDGAVLFHCFGGCPQDAVLAALRARGLWHDGPTSRTYEALTTRSRPMDEMSDDEKDSVETCKRAWEQARPAENSRGQLYLQGRGIVSRETPLPPSLRYVASKDALIAAVTRPDSGELVGLHCIFLADDEAGVTKKTKLSYGPVRFGAIALSAPDTKMQICESLEDGLALLQMNGVATLAVPGTAFYGHVVPPAPCRIVVLSPDADDAGRLAIEKATPRLHGLGFTVRVLLPPLDMDWVDVLDDYGERQAIVEEPRYG
jgi:putative DNA primase/helicase